MLPLLLILLILALAFGGFFVFTLKVAVVIALVLLVIGLFGGWSMRGRNLTRDQPSSGPPASASREGEGRTCRAPFSCGARRSPGPVAPSWRSPLT